MNWTDLLKQLLDRQSLTPEQARSLMTGWLEGAILPEVSGAILVALQLKGVTGAELAAMAAVLREMATPVPKLNQEILLDTCGTGGDGKHTFNISTAVAFVVAAAGIPVAKHGNRSVSSRSGSADVLEALGINLNAPLTQMQAALAAVGVTFLFAPHWHPAMKAVAPLRKNLGIRTVFNLLGPLVNPYRPTAQVLGVYAPYLLQPMAEALHLLGLPQAYVLHSREGLDEVGLGDITDLVYLHQGQITPQELDPRTVDIPPTPLTALLGGDVAANAVILSQVLQGKGTDAQTQCVALNSALALTLAGQYPTWQTAYPHALNLIRSGAPWDKLMQLRQFLAQP
ncbi:MAG: anthranilate phosphoribosyltransferase [Pseudanabaenaceae cyanobacterium SKYGB_i_bin29]|nr:anthranilate phosphoribosyltransferase [Pseudanabaenaceae cyanobacterium SKYG29]MDW8420294.1 anthranilate phosphoribosyltransferase [Pseudanabaenaceae cyanobacterium SKYGB_i_bin29]